jgi:hypothetical protein
MCGHGDGSQPGKWQGYYAGSGKRRAEAVLHENERGTPTSASLSMRVCIETRWLLHWRGKPPGSNMIRRGSELATLPP